MFSINIVPIGVRVSMRQCIHNLNYSMFEPCHNITCNLATILMQPCNLATILEWLYHPSPRPLRFRRLKWRFFCGGPVNSSDGAGCGALLGVCTAPLGYGAARSMAPILGMAITTAGFGAHIGRAATDGGAASQVIPVILSSSFCF